MTVSLWQRESRASLEVDVAIIGGGLCGLGAAIACTASGVRWAILEQHRTGSGASGRNAGYLIRGAAENYARASRTLGRDRARALWAHTESNIAILRGLGLESLPSFERRPSVILAYHEDEATELHESLDLLRSDGFDASMLEGGDDALWRHHPPRAALCNPGDAVVNPSELVEMLAAHAGRAHIHEGQEVDEIVHDGDHLRVRSRGFDVRARRVLVCTNAWAPLLVPELRGVVTPRRGQMIAVRAPGSRLDAAYYANWGSEYFRPGPDGLLLFGGCRLTDEAGEVGYEDTVTAPIQEALEAFATRVLGGLFEVVARWAGTMGFSPDGLPITREVRPGVWFCGGFTGHGMSMAV
ncbi:MAG: FAD-binding oxidoreductase, partial [Phycisphaerales bacterium]|nr:FAD-binding oxidoreductase [Phycisphaerales bacterium]